MGAIAVPAAVGAGLATVKGFASGNGDLSSPLTGAINGAAGGATGNTFTNELLKQAGLDAFMKHPLAPIPGATNLPPMGTLSGWPQIPNPNSKYYFDWSK